MDNDYFGLDLNPLIPTLPNNLLQNSDDRNIWKYLCFSLLVLLGITVYFNNQYKKNMIDNNDKLCSKIDKNINVQKYLLEKYKKYIHDHENNTFSQSVPQSNPQFVRNEQDEQMNNTPDVYKNNDWYSL